MIDKLEFRYKKPLSLARIKERASAANLELTMKVIGKEGWRCQVEDGTNSFFFKLVKRKGKNPEPKFKDAVYAVTTRPSAYTCYTAYLKSISLLLSKDELEQAIIFRMDLAVDYNVSYETVLRGLDFKEKQCQCTFFHKGEQTGISLGKGDESVTVYDKGLQIMNEIIRRNSKYRKQALQGRGGIKRDVEYKEEEVVRPDLTRLEFRLRGSKLPFKKLSEIPAFLNPDVAGDNFMDLFKRVSLSEVVFADYEGRPNAKGKGKGKNNGAKS